METVPVETMQPFGATMRGNEVEFRVWAPHAQRVFCRLNDRDLPMERDAEGNFSLMAAARAGDRYSYVVDDHQPVPDPVSRLLPEGVHGPTEIVDPAAFRWSDAAWRGLDLRDYVLYELHVGTFSPRGTFDGAIERLDYLKDLGITAVEIMPVAAFPGTRNWGYDGVAPYAVQASYGGPDGLKRLVDAAHARGLAVVLDVVYNHLGNEGNYLRLFGPYFTDRHATPWGEAINYDQPGSEGVRRYFVENALYWVREYHMDGLRLDAVQTISDDSPRHILAEIRDRAQALAADLSRRVCLIAESDENDGVLVRPRDQGGYGLDAMWSDDFHHALHTVFTGEGAGYYQDFGRLDQLVRALQDGWAFQGEPFAFWKGEPRATSPAGVPLFRNVIATQNHDQVGNRARGDRLSALVPPGALQLAAALLLLAPHTPLLFMGEEYGETAPFQFFTSYGDPALQKAVREGRRQEFKDFSWEQVPDPEDPATLEASKLTWPVAPDSRLATADSSPSTVGHRPLASSCNDLLAWYRSLLELRRAYVTAAERTCRAELLDPRTLLMQVPAESPRLAVIARFHDGRVAPATSPVRLAYDEPAWQKALESHADGYDVEVFTRR